MKAKHLIFTLFVLSLFGLSSCVKDYSIMVSSQDLRFGLEAESQTIIVNANCKWKITKNDNADWYTISPMSGRAKDSIITVTVNDYPDGDFRGSSFVISSPGGHVHRTVFVSQNKVDFYSMVNKVYGLMNREKWYTDFYDQMIEESYKLIEFDPYDTAVGYQMYFLEDGKGVQHDHPHELYFEFTYDYDPIEQILHIDFETVSDTLESYDVEVLTASDTLYRFFHEYQPHKFERGDMRKIMDFNPAEKATLLQKAQKRKGGEGIFMD